MVERSFAWSGTTTGDAGPYSNTFFNTIIRTLFEQVNRADAGVLLSYNNGVNESLTVLESSPAGLSVDLQIGSALCYGHYYENDAELQFGITSNNDASGDDRIDTLALQIDFINQEVRGIVVEGTVAPVPVPPTLTKTAAIYQIPISYITVRNASISVLQSDIDDTARDYAYLWSYKFGGTGFESYLPRQLMVGLSTATGGLEKFIQKHAQIHWSANSSNFASGAWQDVNNMAELYDPDNLISIATTDDITVSDNGLYVIHFSGMTRNNAAGASQIAIAMYNATQTTRYIMRNRNQAGSSAANELNGLCFVQADAGDVLNFQAYAGANNSGIDGTLTSFGGTNVSQSQLNIFKLTNEES